MVGLVYKFRRRLEYSCITGKFTGLFFRPLRSPPNRRCCHLFLGTWLRLYRNHGFKVSRFRTTYSQHHRKSKKIKIIFAYPSSLVQTCRNQHLTIRTPIDIANLLKMSAQKILFLPDPFVTSSPKVETADESVSDYAATVGGELSVEEAVLVAGDLTETSRLDMSTGSRSSKCCVVWTIGSSCGPEKRRVGLNLIRLCLFSCLVIPS